MKNLFIFRVCRSNEKKTMSKSSTYIYLYTIEYYLYVEDIHSLHKFIDKPLGVFKVKPNNLHQKVRVALILKLMKLNELVINKTLKKPGPFRSLRKMVPMTNLSHKNTPYFDLSSSVPM